MPEAVVFFSFLLDMGVVGEVAEAVERKVLHNSLFRLGVL